MPAERTREFLAWAQRMVEWMDVLREWAGKASPAPRMKSNTARKLKRGGIVEMGAAWAPSLGLRFLGRLCYTAAMTRQTVFNWAVLALLAVLVLNTASIARSLRRIERMERHYRPVVWPWYLMRPPMAPVIATYARSIHLNENTAAPLSRWAIVRTFPTEKECEAYLHRQAALLGFYGTGVCLSL